MITVGLLLLALMTLQLHDDDRSAMFVAAQTMTDAAASTKVMTELQGLVYTTTQFKPEGRPYVGSCDGCTTMEGMLTTSVDRFIATFKGKSSGLCIVITGASEKTHPTTGKLLHSSGSCHYDGKCFDLGTEYTAGTKSWGCTDRVIQALPEGIMPDRLLCHKNGVNGPRSGCCAEFYYDAKTVGTFCREYGYTSSGVKLNHWHINYHESAGTQALPALDSTEYNHTGAANTLKAAGFASFAVQSSMCIHKSTCETAADYCHYRGMSKCTSLEGVKKKLIDGLASGLGTAAKTCDMIVRVGTEAPATTATCGGWAGTQIKILQNTCVEQAIKQQFRPAYHNSTNLCATDRLYYYDPATGIQYCGSATSWAVSLCGAVGYEPAPTTASPPTTPSPPGATTVPPTTATPASNPPSTTATTKPNAPTTSKPTVTTTTTTSAPSSTAVAPGSITTTTTTTTSAPPQGTVGATHLQSPAPTNGTRRNTTSSPAGTTLGNATTAAPLNASSGEGHSTTAGPQMLGFNSSTDVPTASTGASGGSTSAPTSPVARSFLEKLRGTVRIVGSAFGKLLRSKEQKEKLQAAVQADLAGILGVPLSHVLIRNLREGSLVVDYSVMGDPETSSGQSGDDVVLQKARLDAAVGASANASFLFRTQELYATSSNSSETLVVGTVSAEPVDDTGLCGDLFDGSDCTAAIFILGMLVALICISIVYFCCFRHASAKKKERANTKLSRPTEPTSTTSAEMKCSAPPLNPIQALDTAQPEDEVDGQGWYYYADESVGYDNEGSA